MRSPRRQSLELAIVQEREKLLAMGWTTSSHLWKRVKEQHPDVVAGWTDELADERGRELCHESLVAKVRSRAQLPLPMFGETRRTYTVKEGGGFRNVPVELGTLGDVDDDLEVSAKNKKAVDREHRARVQRRIMLWKAPGAHRGMTVVDALRRLQEKAA